jgi:hypothetical protein
MKILNLITTNHSQGIHVQDQFEYLYNGFSSIGANVRYSVDKWEIGEINIILENFSEDSFTESIINIKKQDLKGRLILVVTELIKEGSFNSSNSTKNSTDHYDNKDYWLKRYNNFIKVLPYVNGIACVSETLHLEYSKLFKNTFYLPLCHYQPARKINIRKPSECDIDILFSGTNTNYRNEIIEKIRSKGYNALNINVIPEYIRNDYCERTRLYLGLKLSSETDLLSKFRAHFVLVNSIQHVFEKVNQSTDLDAYIKFAPEGIELIDYLDEVLTKDKLYRQESNDNFIKFKESKDLNIKSVFLNLIKYCAGN